MLRGFAARLRSADIAPSVLCSVATGSMLSMPCLDYDVQNTHDGLHIPKQTVFDVYGLVCGL